MIISDVLILEINHDITSYFFYLVAAKVKLD
jgi:hypothetical protein